MKIKITKKSLAGLALMAMGIWCLTASHAWAEDAAPAVDGVAGCQAVAVDPNMSEEGQQAVCSSAEQNASSSCAASGHGLCSSPKKDGTLIDGTTCMCISETPAEQPAQ